MFGKKILIICLLFEFAEHILPGDKYKKYIRLLGNMALVYVCITQIMSIFPEGVALENMLDFDKLVNVEKYSEDEGHMLWDKEKMEPEILKKQYVAHISNTLMSMKCSANKISVEVDFDKNSDTYGRLWRIDLWGDYSDMEQMKNIREKLGEIYDLNIMKINVYKG